MDDESIATFVRDVRTPIWYAILNFNRALNVLFVVIRALQILHIVVQDWGSLIVLPPHRVPGIVLSLKTGTYFTAGEVGSVKQQPLVSDHRTLSRSMLTRAWAVILLRHPLGVRKR